MIVTYESLISLMKEVQELPYHLNEESPRVINSLLENSKSLVSTFNVRISRVLVAFKPSQTYVQHVCTYGELLDKTISGNKGIYK